MKELQETDSEEQPSESEQNMQYLQETGDSEDFNIPILLALQNVGWLLF
ncbi:MAG: hypothetical protein M3P08_19080 [Thermoproteota archaeon]|nr:hypothetical protein [Thermoproteota archaeon]